MPSLRRCHYHNDVGQNLPSGAISSAVRHLPYKGIVTGSIPVSPIFKSHLLQWISRVLRDRMYSEPTPRQGGVVMLFQDGTKHALPLLIGLMGSDIALVPLPIKEQDGRADPVEELFQSQQQWYCRRTVAN